MSAKICEITIEYSGKILKLSVREAEELHAALDAVLGKRVVVLPQERIIERIIERRSDHVPPPSITPFQPSRTDQPYVQPNTITCKAG